MNFQAFSIYKWADVLPQRFDHLAELNGFDLSWQWWQPMLLSCSLNPAFFPPYTSWPLSRCPMIPLGELPVLTAHVLEEEEQTRGICGKWDCETGLSSCADLSCHSHSPRRYYSSDSDREQRWLSFSTSEFQFLNGGVRLCDFYWFDSLLWSSDMCQPDAAPAHLSLNTI